MKKALGQTVRDIKREVNKKVLKVPSTEQKVMDATSNEPWGPHGSLLADIAHASRNYHEYQMIMSVIWKRINDTGKNWRHVYKALTVLEYLVAHGSERVIDEIREHAYQISTLSDFQYIDSSGRDQGNNVRKKSQSLVVLVNDKERIQEVRQKAASNKDKYRNASTGNLHRPGSTGGYGDKYDDERYGNRDYDRNGSRDDGRNGRYGDTYSQEGDRTSRDYDYRGRSPNTDEHYYGPRSRSADPYRDGYFEDDGQYSSRGSAAKADDRPQDGSTTSKGLERKYSEQNLGAPPSHEDVVGAARSPSYSERDRESTLASGPKASSPVAASPGHTAGAFPPPLPTFPIPSPPQVEAQAPHTNKEVDGFDEFDPRGSFSATPAISNGVAPATPGGAEMDLLGSLSESFNSNSLALVLADAPTATPEATAPANFGSASTFAAASSASNFSNQPFDDPFGDGPFKAMPSSATSAQNPYTQSGPSGVQPPVNPQLVQQDMPTPGQDFVILADILPPSAPSSFVNTQPSYPGHSFLHAGFPPQTNELVSQLGPPLGNSFPAQNGHPTVFPSQPGQPSLPTSYSLQSAESAMQNNFPGQPLALTYPVQACQPTQMGTHNQPMGFSGFSSQMGFSQAPPEQPNPPNPNLYGTYNSQMTGGGHVVPPISGGPITHQNILTRPSSAVPVALTGSLVVAPQPSQDKFETKSTVWADTLSRGLVNLNISGSKTNPLADIGVDFDAINRREKRMEKPTTAAVTSTITMGKAMGSGSGLGRAGAGAIRPPTNPMVGSVGIPGVPGAGMGGYAINPQMGRGMNMPGNMGMGMNMPGSMGMSMNVPGNIDLGPGMQQQMGYPPGSTVPGGYNPMNGSGMYGQPNPYGNGYR